MTLTEEQNQYVLELRVLSDENPALAMKLFADKFGFEICKTTVIKRWGGHKSHIQGGHRFGFTKENFRELYEKYSGDIGDMMEATHYTKKGLLGWCRRCGLEPKNVPAINREDKGPNPKYARALGLDGYV